jgi:hypothetical protein
LVKSPNIFYCCEFTAEERGCDNENNYKPISAKEMGFYLRRAPLVYKGGKHIVEIELMHNRRINHVFI